jgi:hypothetical protein
MAEKIDKKSQDKFESIGWGLFLVLLGITWIVPKSLLADGVLYIGIGIILLGFCYFKHRSGYKFSKFTLYLGLCALVLGFADYFDVDIPLLPLVLIFWGLSMIFSFYKKKPIDNSIE